MIGRRIRWSVPVVAGLVSVAVAGDGPVWPPEGVPSPAEIVWRGAVDELRPRGLGKLFRAIAGAERRDREWQLPRPVSVALVSDRLFVVDTALREVIGVEPDGGGAMRLHLPDDAMPMAVAASPDGVRLLVADRSSGAVLAFDSDGSARGEVLGAGLVERIGGIGVCSDGDLLVTDAVAGEVLRLAADGAVVARNGRAGTGNGEFNTPTAVAEAPDGSIWVLDTFNFRLQRLDPTLEFVSSFGELGDGSGHFALPKGLAVDPDGHLHVSDGRFDVVQVFDEEGRLLLVVGGHGTGDGQFWSPAGVAIGRDGRMAVADTGNRRVQLLQYRRRSPER